MENNAQERIRKEVSKSTLEVSRVYKSDFQKEGTLTAELKQTVVTKSFYPGKSVASDMGDNPFSMQDFNFKEEEFVSTEIRVAWINVPLEATVESVMAKLATLSAATLYRKVSNRPILTDNQLYAVSTGTTTKEVIAASQVIRYPKAHEQAGQIVLDTNGKIQYRSIFFKNTETLDIDSRTLEPTDFFISDALAAELEDVTVVSEQSLA